MLIYELPETECIALLKRVSIARLGSCFENQPYVVPTFFVHESSKLYSFATLGQKTEWMRLNPNVCVEADEITSTVQWASVVVNGKYEELTEQYPEERSHARDLLSQRYNWWQTAAAERQLKSGKQLMEPIFFRISIQSMTGLRAIDEPLYGSLTA